ncbi:leucine-rich repeat-containing protein 15-like [Bradysia coprophila]|uniref:leucine-rich repeat-containing protein 15-like n=1 Tax=Bradysia coprophila TaxID=38358 RepID=UPI00187DAE84|nr:leucine-rich repeat-containing protein 15-like [Bradysia coprophila]
MNRLNQRSNYRFALTFVFISLLQLSNCEKVDVATYCTNVRQTFVCTGLDFGSTDITELELVANEKYLEQSIYFGESNLTTIPKNLFAAFPLAHNIEFENCGIKSVYKWNFVNGETADTLNLHSNQIQQLSSEVFANMDSLNALNLQNNLINEFDSDSFKGLPRLTKLFLSKNNITRIPTGLFSPLVALEEIYLDDNHIEVIDDDVFRFNIELRSINFGKNKIFSFSKSIVRWLGHPYELDVSHNPIEELNLINSDRLILSHTKLTTLRLTNNVYGVVATHTPIAEVVFTNAMDIQKLDLSYNRISDISNITRNGFYIWYLDLSHNPIGHINVKAFSKLTSLRELYLSGTNLLGLDFGSFPYSSPHGEMQLNILDLSYNNLKHFDVEILSYQSNLQSLYLDGNQLSELSHVNLKEYFNNLSEIGLSHNNWNCTFLRSMITHLHRKSIELRVDEIAHNSTINIIGGIECFDVETTTQSGFLI